MAKLFHQSLFNQKLIAKRQAVAATPAIHKDLLRHWAATIADQTITRHKEIAIRSSFLHTFFVQILGYKPFGAGTTQTLHEGKNACAGSADAALFFNHDKYSESKKSSLLLSLKAQIRAI